MFKFMRYLLVLGLVGQLGQGLTGRVTVAAAPSARASLSVVINELDSQMAGTDTLEFIELYDGGVGNTDLTGLVLVWFNGAATNDASYFAVDLDGYSTNPSGYFLIGNSGVPGVGITFTNNSLQNGQDGLGLFSANASNFPNGTPVTNTNLIDAVVYQDVAPGTPDPALVSVLLNPGQAMVFEGANATAADAQSLQRCPNGAGGLRNTATYSGQTPTPGAASYCPGNLAVTKTGPAQAQPGALLRYTMTVAYQGAVTATNVLLTDTLPLSTTYLADSSGFTPVLVAPNTYRWDFGNVTPGTSLTFNLTTTLDIGLAPGTWLTNSLVISGGVVGDGPADNVASWTTVVTATPVIPQVLINEFDAQTFSADTQEYIELYDGGVGNVSLNGLVLVLFDGNDDLSYRALDLDGYATDATGYFLIGNAGVVGVDLIIPNSGLQNGTDAIALFAANASNFPNNTPVTNTNLLDAVVYDDTSTGRADAYMQSVLLNPGQIMTFEGVDTAAAEIQSAYRCPNGYGGLRNTRRYTQGPLTPGADNVCAAVLLVEKDAPKLVAPGARFTYTLTVANWLGYQLNNLVLTDIVPANVQYAAGGTFNGISTTWNVPTLPHRAAWSVTLAVTATTSISEPIVNQATLVAANYTTPTTSLPAITLVGAPPLAIHYLQGFSHLSSFLGYGVEDIHGIVTALTTDGFYMQAPTAEGDGVDATSEGIFVFTNIPSGRAVGDEVWVDGLVSEDYPGGYETNNLATTYLAAWNVTVASTGNVLPAPMVVGSAGRVPPTAVIDNDATGNVDTSGTFDAANDGIDFYESLEGMRVQVNNAVVVGATNAFGEIAVLGDQGALATGRTLRGGIIISPTDFNPERIILDDVLQPNPPTVKVGDVFPTPLVGILDYSFGNFKLLQTAAWPGASGSLISETASVPLTIELSVATVNVENLDPNPSDGDDDSARFLGLANEIVHRLHAPDIIGVQEVQDNTGATNDGVVAADTTFNTLITFIQTVGGPTYSYRQIDPLNDTDGGEPGGNIRVGFLFRTDRGLTFVDRSGGTPTSAVTATLGTGGVTLNYSPGRLDPLNAAFMFSRKPLVGEFIFRGHRLFVIVTHLNSKGGDTPLFGRVQPPVLNSEVQRLQQTQIIHNFVAHVLNLDPQANIIVLGDMNDFAFSAPLQNLTSAGLDDLITSLPAAERYTYVYEGNSQNLDHILVSTALRNRLTYYDIIHMNAEFPEAVQLTDHDPSVAHFTMFHQRYLPFIRK